MHSTPYWNRFFVFILSYMFLKDLYDFLNLSSVVLEPAPRCLSYSGESSNYGETRLEVRRYLRQVGGQKSEA